MFFFETLFLQFLPSATILSLPSLSLATKIATEVASAASYSSCINACNPGLVSLLQKSPLFFITSTTTNFQQKHIPNCKAYSFKPPPPPISNKSTFLTVKLTALAISSNLVIILDCPKNKSCSLSTLLKQPR